MFSRGGNFKGVQTATCDGKCSHGHACLTFQNKPVALELNSALKPDTLDERDSGIHTPRPD